MKFTNLKDTLRRAIRPKLTEEVKYKIGDEVFNQDRLESGRVDEIILPTIFSKNKTILYKFSWTRRTGVYSPGLVSSIEPASSSIVLR